MIMFRGYESVWVTDPLSRQQEWIKRDAEQHGLMLNHWSRWFEYTWAIWKGEVEYRQWVLDAAGGDSPLQAMIAGSSGAQVINVDIDPNRQTVKGPGIIKTVGDLRKMSGFYDNVFDRVFCVSVLEHIERPEEVILELWRVLKPGGRLVVTFDVADNARWNHTIDKEVGDRIVGCFGQYLPKPPTGTRACVLPEVEPKPGDLDTVSLMCFCFCCEKI